MVAVTCVSSARAAEPVTPLVPEVVPDAPAEVTPPPESDAPRLRAYRPGDARVVPPDEARGWAEAPDDETEDAVLLVPRLVLFVPKAALWLVFQPLRGLLYLEDELHVVEAYKDVFFSDDGTIGVLPSLGYQSGYGFSVGLSFFDHDLFGHDEALDVSASFGGREQQSYVLELAGDRFGGSRLWLDARVAYEVKPGLYFFGVGNGERDAPVAAGSGNGPRDVTVGTHYGEDRFRTTLDLGGTLGDPGTLGSAGTVVKIGVSTTLDVLDGSLSGANDAGASEDNADDRRIDSVYDLARLEGFAGSTTLDVLFHVVVDTRDVEGQTSEGTYLEAFAGGAPPVDGYGYGHFGIGFVKWLPLWSQTRVLQLGAFVEGLLGDDVDIPVAELVRMGANQNLRGYVRDRFRDKVAVGATAAYFYPIHQNIQGELFVDVGRVGRDVEQVFDLESWRVGFGGGLVFGDVDDLWFRLEASYGEELVITLTTDPFAAFGDRKDQP